MAADDSRTWPPDAGADGAVRRRANELLEAEGRLPIEHMTPHTLRRTFASILAACDVPPRRAMYLMGHTDAKFTMAVYQHVLDMGLGSVAALESAPGLFARRGSRRLRRHRGGRIPTRIPTR